MKGRKTYIQVLHNKNLWRVLEVLIITTVFVVLNFFHPKPTKRKTNELYLEKHNIGFNAHAGLSSVLRFRISGM
jgi:hypothetical protein